MFHAWIVYRFVTSGRRLLNLPSVMSLLGMTIGVACLVVAMGVVSGFETTLRKSVIDVFGHVLLVRRSDRPQPVEQIMEKIKELTPAVQAYTPFVQLEAVLARNKKISGVLIQGVDPRTVLNVLNIKHRLLRGDFSLGEKGGVPVALVGKGIEKKFELKVGDRFQVVLPSPSRSNSTEFSPKVQTYVVGGVLDLGKNDYDERYIVTDLRSAQKLAAIGENFSGIRLKLTNPELAPEVSARIARELGSSYWTMDWVEVNRNLFEAIKLERVVIFFVLLVMIIAASFNISSHMFVSVLQKFADISILKAMGFSRRDVMRVFTLQGLLFGLIGTALGLALGLVLCLCFILIQKIWVVMPADIYKLDHVGVEIRAFDVGAIILAAIVICLVSTLAPAFKGSRLNPVEGLRYE